MIHDYPLVIEAGDLDSATVGMVAAIRSYSLAWHTRPSHARVDIERGSFVEWIDASSDGQIRTWLLSPTAGPELN